MIVFQETLQEVEQWMDKYDKDMERIDLKIQLMKNDYNSQTTTRTEMEELVRLLNLLLPAGFILIL